MNLLLACVAVLALFGTLQVNGTPFNKHIEYSNVESAALNLQDDLNDLIKLIPQKQIENLLLDYLAGDEDVGDIYDYIMSEEFKSLVIEVEAIPDFKNLLNYLEKAGLNAYDIVNEINDFLGAEKIKPMHRVESSANRITGGLPGLLQDLEKVLPVDKIEKLYNDKLKSSKDFIALIKHLQTKEIEKFVEKVMTNPKVVKLIKKVESKGVDVYDILNTITSIVGIQFPPRPQLLKEEEVIDILEEIWSYVPMDELLKLIVNYMVFDRDFQKVVGYMMGDEFKKILLEVEAVPEIKALAKYFHSVGMNVYQWINDFHDLIGLPPVKPSLDGNTDITGGLPGMIKDIRALLPIDELYELYDEKLESSSKFREFTERLRTGELQAAVNALGKHSGFQSWLTKLENLGVDLNELADLISAITGIKFPQRPSFYM